MPILSDSPIDRRKVLRRGAALFMFGAAAAGASSASAKTAKADVKYLYTPNGSNHCAVCASFIAPPADQESGSGQCKIVDGPIQQNGWCVLFSTK
jgi:hypothetical protein